VEASRAGDARSRFTGAVSFCGAEQRSRLDFSLFCWLHGFGFGSYIRERPRGEDLGRAANEGVCKPDCLGIFFSVRSTHVSVTLQLITLTVEDYSTISMEV
jgi:hypothetical protein